MPITRSENIGISKHDTLVHCEFSLLYCWVLQSLDTRDRDMKMKMEMKALIDWWSPSDLAVSFDTGPEGPE